MKNSQEFSSTFGLLLANRAAQPFTQDLVAAKSAGSLVYLLDPL